MKALIIGGGIGGFAAAISLQQKGISTIVFEQANEIKPVGAGLAIAPNGLEVLNRLGIYEAVFNAGNEVKTMSVSGKKGDLISKINNLVFKDKFGFVPVAIHRADLQQILLDQLAQETILTNKKFVKYVEFENKVEAHFEDGSVYEGDFLIGADGIKSLVRNQLLGNIPLRYSGQTCWRGIADMKLNQNEIHNFEEIWLDQAGLRTAYVQINSHQVYWYITICTPPNGQSNSKETKEYLQNLTKGVASSIHEVINNTNENQIIRNDIFDFAPINNWYKNKVVLIGDAAHATTPNLGQGANQALESSYFLAQAVSKTDTLEKGFELYQKVRIPKAHLVTNRSWQFGQLSNWGSPFAMFLRKWMIKFSPESATIKEFKKVFSLNF